MRIARELHDVVAHHIAVINVQAGVAAHLLRDNPTGAEEALTHVRRGAASVLDELSSILSVIRQSDEATSTTDPLPTLDDLQRLIADFDKVGLEIEWHTAGRRRPVAPAVGLAAYRIIQESLTNAHRYGCHHRATLRLTYDRDALRIEILNDIDADRPVGARRGHGTVGMRERVAAAGGTIEIGPDRRRPFRVHATLRYRTGRTMTIRVLLADDQALIRAGFKALIDSAPDLTVVAEAATGAEAVTLARTSRADIVLMDIRMPDMDGIAATRAITTTTTWPASVSSSSPPSRSTSTCTRRCAPGRAASC